MNNKIMKRKVGVSVDFYFIALHDLTIGFRISGEIQKQEEPPSIRHRKKRRQG